MLTGFCAGPGKPTSSGPGELGNVRYIHVCRVRKRLSTVWKRKPHRLLEKSDFSVWSKKTNWYDGGKTPALCVCGSWPRGEYGLAVRSGVMAVVESSSPGTQ